VLFRSIESDINSILVVNSLPKSESSSFEERSVKSLNESVNYLKQLETEIKRMKEKIDEVKQEKENEINKLVEKLHELKQENFLLTTYNTDLARRLEISANPDKDDDTDSIIEFVDVQNIAKKVEHYLTETNKIFKTDKDCTDSMKYLIKNIWSLIAHDYSDTNLDQLKVIRDELVNKIDRANINTQATTMDSAVNVDLISNNELIESLAMENFAEKLAKQNEIIKLIIQKVEETKNHEPKEQEQQPATTSKAAKESETVSHNDDDDFVSPENEEPKLEEVKQTEPAQSPQNVEPPVMPEANAAAATTANTNNEFYLHYSNGFVNIQAGSLDGTLLNEDNDDPETLTLPAPAQPAPVPEPAPLRTQISQTNTNIFNCPYCNSSFNSTLFETEDVFMDKFQRHVSICNSNSKETCMFCLELFDKSEHVDFNDHVAIHLMEIN